MNKLSELRTFEHIYSSRIDNSFHRVANVQLALVLLELNSTQSTPKNKIEKSIVKDSL